MHRLVRQMESELLVLREQLDYEKQELLVSVLYLNSPWIMKDEVLLLVVRSLSCMAAMIGGQEFILVRTFRFLTTLYLFIFYSSSLDSEVSCPSMDILANDSSLEDTSSPSS